MTLYTFNTWYPPTAEFAEYVAFGVSPEEARKNLQDDMQDWVILDLVAEQEWSESEEFWKTFKAGG